MSTDSDGSGQNGNKAHGFANFVVVGLIVLVAFVGGWLDLRPVMFVVFFVVGSFVVAAVATVFRKSDIEFISLVGALVGRKPASWKRNWDMRHKNPYTGTPAETAYTHLQSLFRYGRKQIQRIYTWMAAVVRQQWPVSNEQADDDETPISNND